MARGRSRSPTSTRRTIRARSDLRHWANTKKLARANHGELVERRLGVVVYETDRFSTGAVGAGASIRAVSGNCNAAAIRRSFDGSVSLPLSMSAISLVDRPQVRESSSILYPFVSRMAFRPGCSSATSAASLEKGSCFAFWGIGNSMGLKSFGSNDRVLPESRDNARSRAICQDPNRPSRHREPALKTVGARQIWDLRPDPPNQVLLKGCTPKCSAVSGCSRVSLMSLATASGQLSPKGSYP